METDSFEMSADDGGNFLATVTQNYYRVRVVDLIAQNKSFHKNYTLESNEIYLWYPSIDTPSLKTGQEMLVCVYQAGTQNGLPKFSASTETAFYITKQDYVLTVSDTLNGFQRYSGLQYDELKRTLVEYSTKWGWDDEKIFEQNEDLFRKEQMSGGKEEVN